MEWQRSTVEELELFLGFPSLQGVEVFIRGEGRWSREQTWRLEHKRRKTWLVVGKQAYLVQGVEKGLKWEVSPYEIVFRVATDGGVWEIVRRAKYKKGLEPEARRIGLLKRR